MIDTNVIIIVLAAFLGALGAGSLGWFESNEPFSFRKFYPTIWRALIAAVVLGLSYQGEKVTAFELLLAFGAGAGIDATGKRLSAGLNARTTMTISELKKEIEKLSGREVK